MIVGRGLLAEAFRPRYGTDPDVVLFAAGVSNSSETRPAEFEREQALLQAHLEQPAAHFVYFSSCVAGFDHLQPSAYVRHKVKMEREVLQRPGSYVFRLPQVVGRTTNPNTLTNYLASRISDGVEFTVYAGAERNLVDIDDIAAIAPELLSNPAHAGRATPIVARYPVAVPKLVSMLEDILGRKANARIVDRQERFVVDALDAWKVADRLGLDLDAGDEYTRKLLRKYYG